ncbi:MAG: PAS domain-containing protein, partial [Cyanobacteria bacterium P01_A01_bin.135]
MDQPSSRLSYTVLIIDKPQDRETYRQYLSQSHHTSTIFEAALGAEGLALYEQHQINAVLLSNDLPDISAVEFLAKLDLSEPWLPVVVVAEDDSASSAVKVMKAGAQDFLVRPQLTATALQHAIESVVHEQYRGYDGCKLALQKQADRLRIATASAHLGIWDWNLAINEITWDNECRAMFGVTPDTEVTTELFFKAVHPSDRDRVEQAVNAALSPSGNGSYEVEYRTIGVEDGVERWIKARGQAYFTHSKKPQRFIGTVVEVTQRKRAELALAERAQELAKLNGALGRMTVDLEERNKDLNQFAYVASHDLKAPLRSIRNLSEWLKEDIGSTIPPENQQQLTLIIERIDRMDA